ATMSERKVLNKYYPPDFDPAKIPKLKLPKDRQYVVRLMAPFNMRCKTCGEYIYKGKKFNARKETVMNELYMGLPIFRFYIKCTRCLAEITFKTDPENTDYAMEHGATRNFQAEKLVEEAEKRVQQEREEEELNNPMKVLENRTKDSKMEMEVLENLQELKELNQRQAQVDFEGMIDRYRDLEKREKEREKEEDERETKEMLDRVLVKRLRDSDSDSEKEEESCSSQSKELGTDKPTDILTTVKPTEAQVQSSICPLVASSGSYNIHSSNMAKRFYCNIGNLCWRSEEGQDSKASTTDSNNASKPVTTQNGSSSLSLLGAYSDSDSE
uniref:Splicing factor YJU2 n=1 Tax=Gasterosteus aculeatus TaxID=69293 RepID=G3P5R6_GASAC